jgi:hypothetical protein
VGQDEQPRPRSARYALKAHAALQLGELL